MAVQKTGDIINQLKDYVSNLNDVLKLVLTSSLGRAAFSIQAKFINKNLKATKELFTNYINIINEVAKSATGPKGGIRALNNFTTYFTKAAIQVNAALDSILNIISSKKLRLIKRATRRNKLNKIITKVMNDLTSALDSVNPKNAAKSRVDAIKNARELSNAIPEIMGSMSNILKSAIKAAISVKLAKKPMNSVLKFLDETIDRLSDKKYKKSLQDASANIQKFTVVILGFCGAVVLIGIAALTPVMWMGMLALSGLILASLGILMIVASKRAKKDILQGSLALLAIAGAFVLYSLSMLILSQVFITDYKAFLIAISGIALLVAMSLGILLLVREVAISGEVLVGVIALLAICTVMLLASMMFQKISDTSKNVSILSILKLTLAMGITVAAITGIGALMGGGVGLALIALGAAAVIATAVPLLILGKAFEKIMSFNLDGEKLKSTMKQIGVATLAMVDAMSGGEDENTRKDFLKKCRLAKKVSRKVARIAVHTTKLADALQHIASLSMPTGFDSTGKAIGYKQMGEDDFKQAAKNISSVIITLITPFIKIANGDVNLGPGIKISKGRIKKIFNSEGLSGSLVGRIIRQTGRMGNAISSLAQGISDMAQLNTPIYNENGKIIGKRPLSPTDFKDAANNTADVITTVMNAIIGVAANPDMRELLESENIFGSSKAGRVIKISSQLGNIISSIAEGVSKMGNMEFVKETIGADGKTITHGEKVKLTAELFNSAGTNVGSVVTNILTALGNAYDSDGVKDIIKSGKIFGLGDSRAEKMIQIANSAAGMMAPIAENIVSFAKGEFKNAKGEVVKINMSTDINTATNNIKTIITGILNGIADESVLDKFSAFGKIDSKPVMDFISNLTGSVSDLTTDNTAAFKSITEDVSALFDKINTTDTTKLQKAATLMSSMAELSKSINGNFDRLAETIDEKLVTTIDKLNESLDRVKDQLTKTNETMSKTSNQTSESEETPTTMTGKPAAKDTLGKGGKQPAQVAGKKDDKTQILAEIKNIKTALSRLTTDGVHVFNSYNSPLYISNR